MAGLEGRTLDRYELRQVMGRGGMADVYRSYDPHFDRDVAVKVFKREDEDLLRRFVREAHLMASLGNAHLMPVWDAGMTVIDNTHVYYIVMPLMEGGTLRSRIRRSPLPPSEACRYLRDIADALDYLHQQGIIHRDIKSSNVLLDANNRCYLSDFGIARADNDDQLTSTGNVLGTVDYIAPELFETNQRANAKSDLYSLGVLLFEMVTGELPFTGENQIAVVAMHVSKQPPSPRSLVPSLSPTLERVVYKALEKRPEKRYSSAGQMAEVFCRAAANLSVPENLLADPVYEQSAYAVSGSSTAMYAPEAVHGSQTGQYSGYVPTTRPVPVSTSATGATRLYSSVPTPSAMYPAYVPPTAPIPRSGKNPRGAIVTIIALIAILAILGPAGYVLYTQYAHNNQSTLTPTPTATQPQPTTNTTGTAQANSSATATQQAGSASATAVVNATATAQASATATNNTNATATAQANATVTAQANATATAGVIATVTARNPIYTDALSDPNSTAQWDGGNPASDHCVFNAGYHVINMASDPQAFQVCHEAANTYTSFAAKVTMNLSSAPSGGILFRMETDGTNVSGYLFQVNSNGQYKISFVRNNNLDEKILQDWTESPALNKGLNTPNTLQFTANGDQLAFYANGVFLNSISATSRLSGGTIGLLATRADQPADGKSEATFSDLAIYSFP